jgi:phospholipase/carboxylesterase
MTDTIHHRQTSIAGLHAHVFQAAAGAPTAAVVLCHGFGAPGDDLVDLAPALVQAAPSLAQVRFYFPAAPLSLSAMGWGESRAWWLIDMEALQRANQSPEALKEFRNVEPLGMAAARKQLTALVEHVANETQLPYSRLALGGFSQGAMLATDVALRLPEALGALCVLSGTLLLEDVWRAKLKQRTAMPVFQSHGTEDVVLPFAGAKALQALFVSSAVEHEFVPFDGGHTIGPSVLSRLAQFLQKRL